MRNKYLLGLLMVLIAVGLGAKTVKSLVHKGCGGTVGKKGGRGTANWCFTCKGRVPADKIVES